MLMNIFYQQIRLHFSPRNVLMNFFDSLRGKKELKRPLQNIHHYHLHYYPVHVQSAIHSPVKSIKAPDKHELDAIHT